MQSTDKTLTPIAVTVKWRVITHKGLVRSQNEDAHYVAHHVDAETGVSLLRIISSLLLMDSADIKVEPLPVE